MMFFYCEALMSYGSKFVPDHRLSVSRRIFNHTFLFLQKVYTQNAVGTGQRKLSRWCINSYRMQLARDKGSCLDGVNILTECSWHGTKEVV